MHSKEVARIFSEIAQILEVKGENPFRIRAYERAALNVENLGEKLEAITTQDKLTAIPGIGADLADKIKEIIKTGSLKYYVSLKKETPAGLLDMLSIQGLGPKTVKLIYDELGIDSIEQLEKATRAGKLMQLEGIREKTQENILRGIEFLKKGAGFFSFYEANRVASSFIEKIKKIKGVEKVELAGSLRRKKSEVKDIDILAISNNPQVVMDEFIKLDLVSDILAKGPTKSSVIAKESNIQVDLRVLDKSSFGSAMVHFTGSKEFNVRLRQLAIKKGYKMNEYGVFAAGTGKKERLLAGKTEEEIFSLVKLDYVAAELREDRGEIEAAQQGKLPKLIELKDIKGDLHIHSEYSDGSQSIEAIAKQAKIRGYKYIGISDHSQSLKIANGLTPKELHSKIEEIKKLNKKLSGIKILCGTEVDILSDGSIDYPDSVLKELDYVIAAVHSGFKQSKEQITKKIIKACKNKYVNIIAHPTGVLRGVREAYPVDLEKIYQAAFDFKVALEINCHPQRMDLGDIEVMKAKLRGAKVFLGTDAHELLQLDFMALGVNVARRGWLQSQDVINCLGAEELMKWLKK